jgi:heptosyltransferase III
MEATPRARQLVFASQSEINEPQPLAPPRWDWSTVKRVLMVRLRSIGDTVLTTPSLFALRRFLPHAQIDILLEDWVAPVLAGSELIDQVISVPRDRKAARARMARTVRAANYDVVYNLHGGTTSTFLVRATGAKHRVGFGHYQYARLHNHLAPQPQTLWRRSPLHSVEQQLALIGWTGVPVTDRPPTRLAVSDQALDSVSEKTRVAGLHSFAKGEPFVLMHPGAAFDTKRWAIEKFARVADELSQREFPTLVIAGPGDAELSKSVAGLSAGPIFILDDLTLPEVTALSSRARLFVGNDSGIAHIAAAAGAACVVIFGSSNVAHWRPWTRQPNEIVREELPCQPCHGYFCAEFDQPECILRVPVERVVAAIDRVLRN